MSISTSSIMVKLEAWGKTAEGQRRMHDKIVEYRNGSDPHVKSTGKTYGGGMIMNEVQMIDAAKNMIAALKSSAASAGLPASVMAHIESFSFTSPLIKPDGSASIQIYMADDPKRASLYPAKYDGVNNIVAIFNCGYTAKDHVYGKWHDKYVSSLDKRQGAYFMQQAVKEFMSKYGEKFDISVELSSEYG